MKTSSLLKVAALALPLFLSACGSKKKAVVEEVKPLTTDQIQNKDFIERVKDNALEKKFITSKVKFSVETGAQKITLTGNLKMKRDDVIRLQLMAFGFVEAGRIELTNDYVLIMDRINKQYLKASYVQVDFLRNNGLNFKSLQSLFWDELTEPRRYVTSKDTDTTKVYSLMESGDDIVITLNEDKIEYSWLAGKADGLIKMANMMYKDKLNGTSQLNWDYQEFTSVSNKKFPKKSVITLSTPNKEVKLGMTLNYIEHEADWETRTEVSNKYREVSVEDILRRFMSL